MNHSAWKTVPLLVALATPAGACRAATLYTTPTSDAQASYSWPGGSWGVQLEVPELSTDYYSWQGSGWESRAVLQFNLAAYPVTATQAILRVYVVQAGSFYLRYREQESGSGTVDADDHLGTTFTNVAPATGWNSVDATDAVRHAQSNAYAWITFCTSSFNKELSKIAAYEYVATPFEPMGRFKAELVLLPEPPVVPGPARSRQFFRVVSSNVAQVVRLDAGGYLTWTNQDPSAACAIETAAALDTTNAWRHHLGVAATSATMRVQVFDPDASD